MSEEWRDGEGENGMSRYGAFSALPSVLVLAILFAALAWLLTGCALVDKAIDWGSQYTVSKRQPTVPDTPPAPPQAAVDAIPRVDVWHGGDLSGATPDERYQLTISPDGRDWSNCPDDWRGGMFPAKCVVAYPSGGKMHAGYYDWLPRPSRRRDFNNFAGNQNGITPPAGQTLYLWAVEGNGQRRSATVHEFIWDGRH